MNPLLILVLLSRTDVHFLATFEDLEQRALFHQPVVVFHDIVFLLLLICRQLLLFHISKKFMPEVNQLLLQLFILHIFDADAKVFR